MNYNEYEDKVNLNVNPEIPDVNKVNDSDMNYIKYNLPHISNEVDEDYRVNLIDGLNIWNEEYKIGYAWNNQSGFPSRATGFIEIKPNTKYTIVVDDISNLSGGTLVIFEKPYIDATTFPTQHEISSDGSTTFTTNVSCYCLAIQLTISSGNISTSNFPKIMIVEGEGTYTYEPLIKRNINVDTDTYAETIEIGTNVDNRSRVNILYSHNLWKLPKTETAGGITFTNNGNGTFNLSGTSTAQADFKVDIPFTENYFKTGRIYTISKTSGQFKVYITSGTTSSWISTVVGLDVNDSVKQFTMTQPSNATLYSLIIRIDSGKTLNITNANIMLNEGGEALDFESPVVPSVVVDNEEIYNQEWVKTYELWNNNAPTSNFAGQDILLNDSINNYKYYEVIFRRSTGNATTFSGGKIPVGSSTELQLFAQVMYTRSLSISGTTATFGDCRNYTTYNSASSSVNNGGIIPVKVLGYK